VIKIIATTKIHIFLSQTYKIRLKHPNYCLKVKIQFWDILGLFDCKTKARTVEIDRATDDKKQVEWQLP